MLPELLPPAFKRFFDMNGKVLLIHAFTKGLLSAHYYALPLTGCRGHRLQSRGVPAVNELEGVLAKGPSTEAVYPEN